MLRKDIYLGAVEQKALDDIIHYGYAETAAAAVRIAVRQFADAVRTRGPLVQAATS